MNDEIKGLFADLNKTLHDQRDAAERKNTETAASLNERLNVMESDLSETKTALARANVSDKVAESLDNADGAEYKSAWLNWIKTGDESKMREYKDAHTQIDAQGGFVVPEVVDYAITELAREATTFEGLVSSQSISTNAYIKNYQVSGTSTRWFDEVQSIAAASNTYDSTPTMARLSIPVHALVSEPAFSLEMIEDGAINMEAFIASEVSKEMAAVRQLAMVSGDGVNKPTGILSVSGVSESITSVKEVASATLGALVADDLLKAIYDVKPVYRASAKFAMNRLTLSGLRGEKDGNGNYIFRYAEQADGQGVIGTLFNFGVAECEDFPDTGKVLTFGDHKGYMAVNRIGMTSLKNPYRISGAVSVFFRTRFGGGLVDAQGLRIVTI